MSLQASDTAARITGSEFLLLLENTEIDRAVARADRLYALLTEPQRIGNDELRHEVSIGIAAYPTDGQQVEELISRAAIARHDAAALPGYLQIYERDRDLVHQRQITLIRDLRRAAVEGELYLCYQPKLDLKWQCPPGRGVAALAAPEPGAGVADRIHPPGRAHRQHGRPDAMGDRRSHPPDR
jgi:predicted signal transduction protein with EAL and GGDEF domain